MNGAHRTSLTLRIILAATALSAIAAPVLLLSYGPQVTPRRSGTLPTSQPGKIVPPTILPPVEPVEMKPVTPEEARAYNATIPFAPGPAASARPFRFRGSDLDRERATDCLATAALYEAGDDSDGERAVAQVVLNRVRHPAFQRTICGVVFAGSERSTGCQFTFTCDGALAHNWSDAAWSRARMVAEQALSGKVDRRVGTATHYHTDWVIPYWSASLDKIAAVGSHLFFRWTGWWGTPGAFRMHYSGSEPRIDALADRFPAHANGGSQQEGTDGNVDAAQIKASELPQPLPGDSDVFLVTLDRNLDSATLSALANRSCGDRDYCKFMAWPANAARPSALPLSPDAMSTMAFSYLRDRKNGFEKALWNCRLFPSAQSAACMNRMLPATSANAKGAAIEKTTAPLPGKDRVDEASTPSGLSGIRRKPGASPASAATSAADAGKDDKG